MSEFLDRLIARSTGTADALRPQPAAVFETAEPENATLPPYDEAAIHHATSYDIPAPRVVQPSSPLVAEPQNETTEPQPARQPPDTAPSTARAQPNESALLRIAPATAIHRGMPDARPDPYPSPEARPAWEPQRAPVGPSTRLQPRRAEPGIAVDVSPNSSSTAKPAATARTPSPLVRQRPTATPHSVRRKGDGGGEPVRQPEAPVTGPADVTRMMPLEGAMAPIDVTRMMPLEGAMAPIDVTSDDRRTRRERAQSALPSAATPPTVQVTIGRVEVRASTRIEPAHTHRQPAVMSLDEYLKHQPGAHR